MKFLQVRKTLVTGFLALALAVSAAGMSGQTVSADDRETSSEPVSDEAVKILNRLAASLPDAKTAKKQMKSYADDEEQLTAYERYLRNAVTSAMRLYESLSEKQKGGISGFGKFEELSDLFDGTSDSLFAVTDSWEQAASVSDGTYGAYTEGKSFAVFDGGGKLSDHTDFDFSGWWAFSSDLSGKMTVRKPEMPKGDLEVPEKGKGAVLCLSPDEASKLGYGRPDKEVYSTSLFFDGKEDEPESIVVSMQASTGTVPDGKSSAVMGADVSGVKGASTKDSILLNLWDYDSDVNLQYFDKDPNYLPFLNFSEAIYGDGRGTGDILSAEEGRKGLFLEYGLSDGLEDGYPMLDSQTSLGYLFREGKGVTQANPSGVPIDGLFRYEKSSGSYVYDSRKTAAVYDSKKQAFHLYDAALTLDSRRHAYGGFYPFQKLSASKQAASLDAASVYAQQKRALGLRDQQERGSRKWLCYDSLYRSLASYRQEMDEKYGAGKWKPARKDVPKNLYQLDETAEKNVFFGMDGHFQFLQPKDGQVAAGESMVDAVFTFSSEDFGMVYVDGHLALDLTTAQSGFETGLLDFRKGKVYYYKGSDEKPYRTVLFSDIFPKSALDKTGKFSDGTIHGLDFYQINRTAGGNALRLQFNLPLLKRDSLYVGNELAGLSGKKASLEFSYQVLNEGVKSYSSDKDLFLKPGTAFAVCDGNLNPTRKSGAVGKHGIFSLAPGTYARFSFPEGKPSSGYFIKECDVVSELPDGYGVTKTTGVAVTEDVPVNQGVQTFSGLSSPVRRMSDGTAIVVFDHQVDEKDTGSFSILHQASGSPDPELSYKLHVSLDDKPLPADSSYAVVGTDGKRTDRKVAAEGVVLLREGESAVFDGLDPGVLYSVVELKNPYGGHGSSWALPDTAVQKDGVVSGKITKDGKDQLVCKHRYTQVRISSTDLDGNCLPGSKLMVYGEKSLKDGMVLSGEKPLFSWVSEDKPYGISGSLPAGVSYWLVEDSLAVSEDYLKAQPLLFKVEPAGKETSVILQHMKKDVRKGFLSVSNQVTGSGGNKEKDFSFQLMLDAPVLELTGTKNNEAITLKGIPSENGGCLFSFTLKDSELILLSGLPEGAFYQVIETDNVGYAVTKERDSGVFDYTESDRVDVQFRNHKDLVVPTGIRDSGGMVWPFVAAGIGIFGAVGVGIWMWYRKRYYYYSD